MNWAMICDSINPTTSKMRTYFLTLFTIINFAAISQPAIPELWGTRIHDEAKVLSPAFINQLEGNLKIFEDSTSNQIAILIIPTLDDYPIEEFSLHVAEKWKLGQSSKDNGILLLAVINDRKVRIETGEGLEGVLPDIVCNQIIRNQIAPNFRQENYEAGIQAAVAAIEQAIKGEYQAESKPAMRRNRGGGSLVPIVIIIIVLIIISRIRGGGNRGRGWSSGTGWYGGGFGGGFGGGGGWSGGGGGGFSGGGGGFGGGGSSGSW
jgi:uncharacterized protein